MKMGVSFCTWAWGHQKSKVIVYRICPFGMYQLEQKLPFGVERHN